MKRIVLTIIIVCFSITTYSQVSRLEFANTVFNLLYESDNNPDNYAASQFPNPYNDIGGNSTLFKKVLVLSYLQYDDGIPVFYRNNNFYPSYDISRVEAIKTVVEAWGIPEHFYITSPFNDVSPGDPLYGYLCSAYHYGMISGGTVNPYSSIYNSEAQDYMTWVANSAFHPIPQSALYDLDNYFIPNNYRPDNIGYLRGLEHGVFSHYAKNSFVIPDRKFNLNFSHYYSTQLVELPESYFPINPLGRGWTHTYNAFITREENVIGNDDLYYIKWADGRIDIYNDNENEYITKGVYDELDEEDGGDIVVITKKDQTKYQFLLRDPSKPIFYLDKIIDSNGNEIDFIYGISDVDDDLERLTQVIAPSGKKLRFYYLDNTDLIDYIQDPIGRQIHFTYNEERLKYFYDAKNQETKYYYLSNDEDAPDEHQYKRFLLKRVRLPEGNSIRAEYDDNDNGKLESYRINDNVSTLIDVDYSDYEAITSTIIVPMPNSDDTQDFNYQFDINGMVTHFDNDNQNVNITYPDPTDNNPLLPTNMNMNGLDVDYTYDNDGNVKSIQVENNEDEDFWYDSDNNLTQYQDENGNDTYFFYDNSNNLLLIEDALGNTTNFLYDEYGQVVRITNQEGISVNYTYENDGAVSTISAPENLTSSYTYDGINRLTTQTINGQISSFTYDPNDNLTSQTNIGGLTTSFDYDGNDNLVTITNANGIDTSFEYNEDDQAISESFNGLVKQYLYNEDGTLDRYIKPSGDEKNYEYTNSGQLDEAGTITDIDYYGNNDGKKEGLIERIYSNSLHYVFDYDNLNQLDEVQINGDSNNKVNYDYDNVGNITQIGYPDDPSGYQGFEVNYIYDAKNRITNVTAEVDNQTYYITQYTYRDDDLIQSILYGNGIVTDYIYDDAGRNIGISHRRNSPFYTETLSLDSLGNITNVNTGYEATNSLSHLLPDINEQSFSYDDNNRIQSPYSVNNDGNLTNYDANTTYTYDIDDQLLQRTTENETLGFLYDPYGNRISKTINNENSSYEISYVWDILNSNLIQETNPINNSVSKYHIYGLGLEATIFSTGVVRYYHGDTRGNVVSVTQGGNQLYNKKYIYDDFGNVKRLEVGYNPDNNYFTFLGKYGIVEDDREDGLYYIRARYYDAKLGRFLTQDPIWSTNLYPYANNNPISRVDVNGKFSIPYTSDPLTNFAIYHIKNEADVINFGVEGHGTAGFGNKVSGNYNWINKGEHSSICPIATGSHGGEVGYDASIGVSGGIMKYFGDGDFQPEYLESNYEDSYYVNVSLGPFGIGGTYDIIRNTEGGKIGELYGVNISGSARGSVGGYSTGAQSTRTLLNYNEILGNGFCRH